MIYILFQLRNTSTVISAQLRDLPTDLITKAFTKVRLLREKNVHEYVLKLRGKQEFLIGKHPLYEYKVGLYLHTFYVLL